MQASGFRFPNSPTKNVNKVRSQHGLFLVFAVVVATFFGLIAWMAIRTHLTVSVHRQSWQLDALRCQSHNISTTKQAVSPRRSILKVDALFWVEHAQRDLFKQGVQLSESCSVKLGEGFLANFANASGTLCGSEAADSISRVQCVGYPVKQQGIGCLVNNLALDGYSFMGPEPPVGAAAHDAYLPIGQPGSVRLACSMVSRQPGNKAVVDNLQQEQLPWIKKAYTQATIDEVRSVCSEQSGHITNHPVMFVSRLDATNPYHHTQSIVQAFLTLAALSNNKYSNLLDGLQVIIADHFIEGPFMEFWRRLSAPHPVRLLPKSSGKGDLECFKQAILAHYASPSAAFLGYEGVGQQHTCPSVLLSAVSHWLRWVFLGEATEPELAVSPQAQISLRVRTRQTQSTSPGHQRLNVVFVSRSWFERAMLAGGGLNSWQKQRVLAPEQENMLTHALQEAVQRWNLVACVPPVFGWWQKPTQKPVSQGCKKTNVTFDFLVAELSLKDFYPDQVMMFANTAVLVAAHGAALTNMMFMRPHMGAIVELWYSNYHYANQANMLGHKHFQTGSDPIAVASALSQAMDHVASRY